MPIEMVHYSVFQSGGSLSWITISWITILNIPHLRTVPEARIVVPVPAPVYPDLPPVSAVRPRTPAKAGAAIAVQKLMQANIFAGQSQEFIAAMQVLRESS
jgi:hypothetical protein